MKDQHLRYLILSVMFLFWFGIFSMLYAGDYDYPELGMSNTDLSGCQNPMKQDRWSLEPGTPEEHGLGTYVFKYYNSLDKCSNNEKRGVVSSDGKVRIIMDVTVGVPDREDGERNDNELIKVILPEGSIYQLWPQEPLNLPDGAEPGIILLLPLLF